MKKHIIFLTILLSFLNCSKEKELKNTFVGKVWVVDSIKSHFLDDLAKKEGHKNAHKGTWNNILKPVENGEFDVYKDQTPLFSSFKISNDTLYLKVNNLKKLEPFSLEKVNDYTYKAKSLNKNLDEYEYYLTDLTDLFKGQVQNKGELYQSIQGKTWYPIEVWKMSEKVNDETHPEFYLKELAFAIQADSLEFTYGLEKESVVKVTKNGMYLLNPKDNSLTTFDVTIKDNFLEMTESSTRAFRTKFKKIDKSILKNKKDLPKKVRLNCSEIVAELMFKDWISEDVNSSFYYDTKTIKLINSDEEDCRYSFTVINRSRQFYDIYSTHKYVVYYTEDGRISMEGIR